MASKTSRDTKDKETPEMNSEKIKLQGELDKLYDISAKAREAGTRPRHKNLLEIMTNKQTIIEAMDKISSNDGHNTAGIDGQIWDDWEHIKIAERVDMVKEAFRDYQPQPVRRVYIEKEGTHKKRPLGIPTIIDRVIQECVRKVLEPICEAQFYAHSYGFRPNRSAHNALARINFLLFKSNCKVAVEGDIKGYFDNINHRKLLRRMWHIGIRDRRVLAIITKMLKAGIIEKEIFYDSITGTPQGGVISPLLANIYLDKLDEFIYKQWEHKKTKTTFSSPNSKASSLMSAHKRGSLKLMPMYIVRYADDWIIFTTNVEYAKKIKDIVSKFLEKELNLTLSEEKTHITDTRKGKVKFVGFSIGLQKVPRSKEGWKVVSTPIEDRMKKKVSVLRNKIRKLRRAKDDDAFFNQFMGVNSTTIGLINYYTYTSRCNIEMKRYAWSLAQLMFRIIRKRFGTKKKKKEKHFTTKADDCHNNKAVLQAYKWKVPFFEYKGMKVGFVRLDMCKFKKPEAKKQEETRYSNEGRNAINDRKIKTPFIKRLGISEAQADWILSRSRLTTYDLSYIFNRDIAILKSKGRCQVCNVPLLKGFYHVHHKQPNLPKKSRNKVENLTAVCTKCHNGIHHNTIEHLINPKHISKLLKLRDLLSDDKLIS